MISWTTSSLCMALISLSNHRPKKFKSHFPQIYHTTELSSFSPTKYSSTPLARSPKSSTFLKPSTTTKHAILAIPGRQKGHIQIVDLNKFISTTAVFDEAGSFHGATANGHTPSPGHGRVHPKTTQATTTNVSIIAAHTGKLSALVINNDGSKCASASEKGTLIRVFDTSTGKLLNELRRGVDRAEIYSIAFNSDSTRLCVSSDKGTVHIFNLDPAVVDTQSLRGPHYGEVVLNPPQGVHSPGFTMSGNRGSSFSFMKDLLPKYFSSEWSFAHAKVVTESRCIVGFGAEKNSIIVICADGSCYKFYFDVRKGGECTRESYERFLKEPGEE
ncbi:hypothetical protein BC938DRAFT_472068 [Jimgerdemannia flammicorona]|uniref:WD40-repeat-containing domain protein n=1 Tax=Jimgerdemannia flammicorona TaxID=994334 RepID=A0A433Q6U0_9FUNG|nr:hypothetical protein BC938DRAFT_472068 [Jimgerdemannia flammicorona]